MRESEKSTVLKDNWSDSIRTISLPKVKINQGVHKKSLGRIIITGMIRSEGWGEGSRSSESSNVKFLVEVFSQKNRRYQCSHLDGTDEGKIRILEIFGQVPEFTRGSGVLKILRLLMEECLESYRTEIQHNSCLKYKSA